MARVFKNFFRLGAAGAVSLGFSGCGIYEPAYQEKSKKIYEEASSKEENETTLGAARTASVSKRFREASDLYEKAGLFYCAAEAAEKAGDPVRAMGLFEKLFNEEWNNKQGLMTGINSNIVLLTKLMGSENRYIKERVINILEYEKRYSLAGDFSLEIGDKERAFENYKNARINTLSLAQLVFDIAKDAEKQGEWSKAVRYFNEAELLNGDETGEIKWRKGRLDERARKTIESLVEEGDLLKAAKMARDIGDEKKAELVESLNKRE